VVGTKLGTVEWVSARLHGRSAIIFQGVPRGGRNARIGSRQLTKKFSQIGVTRPRRSGSSRAAQSGRPSAKTDRYLARTFPCTKKFGRLHKHHPEKFDKVLLLNGRKRRYFAKTEKELEESGSSVMPKRIPDSPYWVFTNSPTELKKQVITDVMRVLGYEPSVIRSVTDALSRRLTA